MKKPANRISRPTVESARALAARLPDLLVDARHIAASVLLGVHGRRRPGPGETFWQFRPYVLGEPAKSIDWRRSARDRQHLYVREREWEAAQTVWLWADLSPSMLFCSQLSQVAKIDRAIVLLLALADLLGRGGERVGVPGLVEPRLGNDAAERIATALMHHGGEVEWPSFARAGRFSEIVVISDFLSDLEMLRERLQRIAGRGTRMHMMQVFDPAEESFPYDGRLEFRDPESGDTWLAERAGEIRSGYQNRLAAHRAAISGLARRAGFSFSVHHTDRPAAEGLLFLYSRLAGERAAPDAANVAATAPAPVSQPVAGFAVDLASRTASAHDARGGLK